MPNTDQTNEEKLEDIGKTILVINIIATEIQQAESATFYVKSRATDIQRHTNRILDLLAEIQNSRQFMDCIK